MHERGAEACASETEGLAAIGCAVVEIQGVRRPEPAERTNEDGEHVDLALLMTRLDRDDVT